MAKHASVELENPPATTSKRDKARFLTQEVKANVRELLSHDDRRQSTPPDELFEDAAFDPQSAFQPERNAQSSLSTRLNIGAKVVANTIKSPKAVSRNNYARRVATKIANHPHETSTAIDDELLDAHDALAAAQESAEDSGQGNADTSAETRDEHLASAQSRVRRVEEQREDLMSGWLLGRHVVRAKVVRPRTVRPTRAQFTVDADADADHAHPQVQLAPYLGHLLLWYSDSIVSHRIDDFDKPPFDLAELAMAFERLAAISTPWQSFFAKARLVYRWDKPARTARFMIAYWLLWYFRQITTFCVAYIIYTVIRNKVYPSTVQAVRERTKRARDQSEQVHAWGELIQKYGSNDWVEPLLDGVGPHVQLQASDLAMWLERLQNFYRWERPEQTWLSLGLFSLTLVFLILASTELCVQVLWFGLGCSFFYSFPISSRYPKYRHVARFWCWIFWGVPDSAELSIIRLQEKVVRRDIARMAALDYSVGSTTSSPAGELNIECGTQRLNPFGSSISVETSRDDIPDSLKDIRASDRLKFKTTLLPLHLPSRLILTRSHIIFEPKGRESFSYTYEYLLEMRKVELDRDSDKSSHAPGRNILSPSSHIAQRLERATTMQLSPDGLGFVFRRYLESGIRTDYVDPASHRVEQGPVDARLPAYGESGGVDVDRDMNSKSAHAFSNLPQEQYVGSASTSHSDDSKDPETEITLILNRADRDKIFAVVLAWSGLRWQPLFSRNRQQRLGRREMKEEAGVKGAKVGNLNENLDDAMKRGLC